MKNADLKSRKKLAKERVYRQFFLYFYSDIIGNYFIETRNKLKEIKNPDGFDNAICQYRMELKELMAIRHIPEHWFVTFCEVFEKGTINLPLHESICFVVGDYQIINKKYDKNKVQNSKIKTVSIQIASKTTKNQVRDFVELNSDLLIDIMSALHLRKLRTPRMDNFGEGTMSLITKEVKNIDVRKLIKKTKYSPDDGIDRTIKMLKNYKEYLSPIK